jgi:hypothetical protein
MATNIDAPYPVLGTDGERSEWIQRNTAGPPARAPEIALSAKVRDFVEQRLAATIQTIADVTGTEVKKFVDKRIAEHAQALPHSGTPARFVAIKAGSVRELKGSDSLAAPGAMVCANVNQLADELFALVEARLEAEHKGASDDTIERRLSRHADHLSSLETRLKRLEHGGGK